MQEKLEKYHPCTWVFKTYFMKNSKYDGEISRENTGVY
jgi:hypothetical protein